MTIIHASHVSLTPNNDCIEALRSYSSDPTLNNINNTIYIPKGNYIFDFNSNIFEKIIIRSNLIFEPSAIWEIKNSLYNFYQRIEFASLSRRSFLLDPITLQDDSIFMKCIIELHGQIYASKQQIFNVKTYPTFLKGYQKNNQENLSGSDTLTLDNYRNGQEFIFNSAPTQEYYTCEANVRFSKNSPNTIIYPEWWGAGKENTDYEYRWLYIHNREIDHNKNPRWKVYNYTADTNAIQACLLAAYPPLSDGAQRQVIKFEGNYSITSVALVPGLIYEGFGSFITRPSKRSARQATNKQQAIQLLFDLLAAYLRHVQAKRNFNIASLRGITFNNILINGAHDIHTTEIDEEEIFDYNNFSELTDHPSSLYDTTDDSLARIAKELLDKYNHHLRLRHGLENSPYLIQSNRYIEDDRFTITNTNDGDRLIQFVNELLPKLSFHQISSTTERNISSASPLATHLAPDEFNLPGFSPQPSEALFQTNYYLPYFYVKDQERIDKTLFSNFHLDGNVYQQGSVDYFELEEASLLKLHCNHPPNATPRANSSARTMLNYLPFNLISENRQLQEPIRLNIDIKNCIFSNSAGDGLSCSDNIQGTWINIKCVDCFRTGIAILGGGNHLTIENFISEGQFYKTGIDIEINQNQISEASLQTIRTTGILSPTMEAQIKNGNSVVSYTYPNHIEFKNSMLETTLQIQLKPINLYFWAYVLLTAQNYTLYDNYFSRNIIVNNFINAVLDPNVDALQIFRHDLSFYNLHLKQGPFVIEASDSKCAFYNSIISITEHRSAFNPTSRSGGLNTIKANELVFKNCKFEIKPQSLLQSFAVGSREFGLVRATSNLAENPSFMPIPIHEYMAIGLIGDEKESHITISHCTFEVKNLELIQSRSLLQIENVERFRYFSSGSLPNNIQLNYFISAIGLVGNVNSLHVTIEDSHISKDYSSCLFIPNLQSAVEVSPKKIQAQIYIKNTNIQAQIGILSLGLPSNPKPPFINIIVEQVTYEPEQGQWLVLSNTKNRKIKIRSAMMKHEHAYIYYQSSIPNQNLQAEVENEVVEDQNFWGRVITGNSNPNDDLLLQRTHQVVIQDIYQKINPSVPGNSNPNVIQWKFLNKNGHVRWFSSIVLSPS